MRNPGDQEVYPRFRRNDIHKYKYYEVLKQPPKFYSKAEFFKLSKWPFLLEQLYPPVKYQNAKRKIAKAITA